MTYEERTEEVRKQVTWLSGKSILPLKTPAAGVCLICLRNGNEIRRVEHSGKGENKNTLRWDTQLCTISQGNINRQN